MVAPLAGEPDASPYARFFKLPTRPGESAEAELLDIAPEDAYLVITAEIPIVRQGIWLMPICWTCVTDEDIDWFTKFEVHVREQEEK